MRYINLYENFQTENVEDLLLGLIDDGKCRVSGNEFFRRFNIQDDHEYEIAHQRLIKHNVKNYIISDIVSGIEDIYSYSHKLDDYLNGVFKKCQVVKPKTEFSPASSFKFWVDGEKVLFGYSSIGNVFYVDYSIWNTFETKFGMWEAFVKIYLTHYIKTTFNLDDFSVVMKYLDDQYNMIMKLD